MNKGITLLEVVIVIAIIGILLTITTFSFSQFRNARALTQSRDTVISVLSEARSRTLASVNGEQYGVHILSDRVVLFVGSTYDPLSTTNELFYYESPVVLGSVSLNGGGSTIVFQKISGITNSYGTIVLQKGSDSYTVSILPSGIINQ